jgi:hypothetical protein
MIRLAVLERDAKAVRHLLAAAQPKEQGCFLLLRDGRASEGRRLVALDLLLPPDDAWEGQTEGHLRPSARWISAAVSRAVSQRAGLLFIHSHPDSDHPVGLSRRDRSAIASLGAAIAPVLEGPFAAVAVHPEGWAGEVWDGPRLGRIDRLVSVGRTLHPLSAAPSTLARGEDVALDARQVDALGMVHARLRELHVAVVGAGGLGSPIAEQLVRMAVSTVTLVDHDALDTPSNVRRVFGSVAADLRATTPPGKVDVVGRHLDQLGLGVTIRRITGDVRSEPIFRALLDADVVICGTDTHGSRAAMNELASPYLLPVIDVGVRVGAKTSGALAALVAELRVLTPVTPCLWCRGAISADVIRAENLPAAERARLEAEGYLVGAVGGPAPSVVALTVLGSSLATCALLVLLSEEGKAAPSGVVVDGFLGYSMETQPTEPVPGCRCRRRLGMGDAEPPPLLTST